MARSKLTARAEAKAGVSTSKQKQNPFKKHRKKLGKTGVNSNNTDHIVNTTSIKRIKLFRQTIFLENEKASLETSKGRPIDAVIRQAEHYSTGSRIQACNGFVDILTICEVAAIAQHLPIIVTTFLRLITDKDPKVVTEAQKLVPVLCVLTQKGLNIDPMHHLFSATLKKSVSNSSPSALQIISSLIDVCPALLDPPPLAQTTVEGVMIHQQFLDPITCCVVSGILNDTRNTASSALEAMVSRVWASTRVQLLYNLCDQFWNKQGVLPTQALQAMVLLHELVEVGDDDYEPVQSMSDWRECMIAKAHKRTEFMQKNVELPTELKSRSMYNSRLYGDSCVRRRYPTALESTTSAKEDIFGDIKRRKSRDVIIKVIDACTSAMEHYPVYEHACISIIESILHSLLLCHSSPDLDISGNEVVEWLGEKNLSKCKRACKKDLKIDMMFQQLMSFT